MSSSWVSSMKALILESGERCVYQSDPSVGWYRGQRYRGFEKGTNNVFPVKVLRLGQSLQIQAHYWVSQFGRLRTRNTRNIRTETLEEDRSGWRFEIFASAAQSILKQIRSQLSNWHTLGESHFVAQSLQNDRWGLFTNSGDESLYTMRCMVHAAY